MAGEGKEGDWHCGGCGNRNYAFRSFCNRCKQARLLVDVKTPADSKWLPRIGDWICTGCTNNNYASREKCKKCGQPKEIAAMPAMPGMSLPTQSLYFSAVQGTQEQNILNGFLGNGALQQPVPLGSNWPLVGGDRFGIQLADKFGVHSTSAWPIGGSKSSGIHHLGPINQTIASHKGWRNGDWICNCGFHNYSSRTQCKKCNAHMPPATPSSLVETAATVLGTKRLASEEFAQDWDSKRLNAGQTLGQQQIHPAFEQWAGSTGSHTSLHPSYPSPGSAVALNLPINMQLSQLITMPALPGKGAKQWRNGDWMCTNCNNHNYSSRVQCNRCKTPREVQDAQPVSVA